MFTMGSTLKKYILGSVHSPKYILGSVHSQLDHCNGNKKYLQHYWDLQDVSSDTLQCRPSVHVLLTHQYYK